MPRGRGPTTRREIGLDFTVITFLATTDPIKLSALQALLDYASVDSIVFDRAAGTLWTAIIPLRLMVADEDLVRARAIATKAGWVGAPNGEWDLSGIGSY